MPCWQSQTQPASAAAAKLWSQLRQPRQRPSPEVSRCAPSATPAQAPAGAAGNWSRGVALIEFTDFLKVSLRIGQVLSCEKVKGSDKLLCSQIDLGGEVRQIVSGIAQSYQPEDMPGRQVVVVTNLKPRKIRGVESNGMLLCATTAEGYRLLTVDQPVPAWLARSAEP